MPAHTAAASHAMVVSGEGEVEFSDLDAALARPGTDVRIFAKPRVAGPRRMGVALALGQNVQEARIAATQVTQALHTEIG